MLSKSATKYIKSLQNKKSRKTEGVFLVEGIKNVVEVLASDYLVLHLYCTQAYAAGLQHGAERHKISLEIVSEQELNALGTLETNYTALALVKMKADSAPTSFGQLTFALAGINDPGNLGTILRIADWYGVKQVICSEDTVELYNPKVLNASKGSFTRVQVWYTSLADFFRQHTQLEVLAAEMNGESLYEAKLSGPAVLLMGNEANGIDPELALFATRHLTIPRIGLTESLNVAVATGIITDRLLGK